MFLVTDETVVNRQGMIPSDWCADIVRLDRATRQVAPTEDLMPHGSIVH